MATPQAIADTCAYLIKVYGSRAKAQLGDDLAKDMLFTDLEGYSNEELEHAIQMMRRGQESVFSDGQSIYAVILKWVKQARTALRRQRMHEGKLEDDRQRSEEMRMLAKRMTPEKMAINKMRVRLISEYRFKEAMRFSSLSEEEALKLLPKGAVAEARKIWNDAHAGIFKRVAHDVGRLEEPPPLPQLPDKSGGEA